MSGDIDALLARLAAAGIQLRVEEGEKLRYRAPKGALTPELAAEIKSHRSDILAKLSQANGDTDGARIPTLPDAPHYALSQAQWRLWVLMQIQPDATAYNVPLHLEFRGILDASLVERVFSLILARHEALRTRFVTINDEPRQVVDAPTDLSLERVDLTAESNPMKAAHELAQRQTEEKFDLEHGPLIRLTLLRLAEQHHVLLLSLHHIIADGTSFGILLREFGLLYEAGKSRDSLDGVLPPLSLQYRDYAAWQNSRLHDPAVAAQGRFWREQLGGTLPVLELPTDRPRPPQQTHAGREILFHWDLKTTEDINRWCQQGRATLFMGLVAVVKLLLYRYTGQRDLIVGSPIAGRSHPALSDQIGYYLNALALRSSIDPEANSAQHLATVKQSIAAAFDHQDYPFDFLVNELGLQRDLSRSPLFDVMVILQNQDESGSPIPDLKVDTFLEPSTTSKLDLTFYFKQRADGLHGTIEYNPDLFDDGRVNRMVDHLRNIAEQLAHSTATPIADIDLLTIAERTRLQREFNDTAVPLPDSPTVVDLIAAQVERSGDTSALEFGETSYSYRELNQRAAGLANVLRERGAARGQRIGVCLERSPELVISLLAIMQTEAAYVPLDPGFPTDRLAFILEDADVSLLIASSTTAARIAQPHHVIISPTAVSTNSTQENTDGPSAEDLAYILHTSGSTGRPKGVAIEHRGLLNFLQAMQQEPGLSAGDRLLAVTTISFDIAGLELWLPLMVGATIVLAERATTTDGHRLLDTIRQNRITFLQATPATWRLLLETGWEPHHTPELVMACGGEAMPGSLARELLPRGRELWNLYGPTETTIWSTAHRVTANDAQEATVTIGRPIANTTCLVLDERGDLAPVGVPGELVIGGAGVARGYWRRDALTAEKFILRSGEQGEQKFYRTGDLVRWHEDGQLQFQGRLDHQVKVRGFRIELGEIEAILTQSDEVRAAAVTVTGDILTAFIETSATEEIVETLRDHTRACLPDYMVPSRWVVLTELPLTANGKVNRKALPEVEVENQTESSHHTPPRTPTEHTLAAIWSEVLERTPIGVTESFFDLGGHSLKVARVVARIRRELGADLTFTDVFSHPTIEELAVHCIASQPVALPSEMSPPSISTQELSLAQRRLWVLEKMRPGTAAYNLADAWRIVGPFDSAKAERLLRLLVERHASLRTTFLEENDTIIAQVNDAADFSVENHATGSHAETSSISAKIITSAAATPFDLTAGPLFRAVIVRESSDQHVVAFIMHHIISDGWSVGLIMQEFATLYNQSTPPLDCLPSTTPYQTYADAKNHELASPSGRRNKDYWQQKLGGAAETLVLPTDFERPPVLGARGKLAEIRFEAPTFAALRALAKSEGATDFMVLVTLVNALLFRYTHQTDLRVGTPVAGRDQADWENTVGFFVNTVVIRNQFTDTTDGLSLLRIVKQTCLDAMAHQSYPFDQLVDDLQPDRDLSRNPLFDVSIQHEPRPTSSPELTGLAVSRHLHEEIPLKCDLSFDFGEDEEGLICGLIYNPDIFTDARIQRLAEHLQNLAGELCTAPATPLRNLRLMGATELDQASRDFVRGPTAPAPAESLVTIFDSVVRTHSETIAVTGTESTLSYKALHQEVERVAHNLVDAGVQAGDIVGVMLERGPSWPIALLAVMRVGGIYLPVDPVLPATRIEYLFSDTKTKVVICDDTHADRIPMGLSQIDVAAAAASVGELPEPPTPSDPAYVIYTSGSTGQPKGVVVSHGAYANTARAQREELGWAPGDRVLQFANSSFDASIFEMLGTLLSGATLVTASSPTLVDPSLLLPFLQQQQVSIAVLPPSFVRAFEQAPLPLRMLITAGESAVSEDAQFYANQLTYVNAYGPTEAAVWSSFEIVSPDAQSNSIPSKLVPIGRPLAGTEIHVWDEALNPVPIGVPGEIYLAGHGLATGYWNQPDLTATSFISRKNSDYDVMRLYRTGDIGQWLPDGRLNFLGRRDGQMKLRGHRIESGEIEHTLREHPDIQDASVMLRHDRSDTTTLTAYAITSGSPSTLKNLRPYLAERLPEYMIPDAFVPLSAWPLTPAGKINRKALPAPEFSGQGSAYAEPQDDVERFLATVFGQVLEIPQVGRDDRFFQIGGNSLLALRVVTRIREGLRVDLAVPEFFAHPTVAMLGAALRTDPAQRSKLEKIAAARAKLAAMTPAQKQALLKSHRAAANS